ncbi:MAG: DUF4065 domain-containing protein [Planctomycetes bacterium]|nr:DUF4065 domain-containing protein [Planctomycetota bacterium]
MSISKRNILLLMLGIGKDETDIDIANGINGITRLQKFLFLLENENYIEKIDDGYQFEAYKAGPYSPTIYDDLEFLENLGLIKSETSGVATEEEAADMDFTFEELMDDEELTDDEIKTPDLYDEKRFRITEDGAAKVKAILQQKEFTPVVDGIRKIKSKFGHYSLDDLLYYVYTKYPDMTTESEIKDHVLRKGRRR